MLDKTITIRELLTYTAILTVTFLIMIFFFNHQVIDNETLFSGAIVGVVSSLFYGLYIAAFKEPLRLIVSRNKSQGD
jgi:preprotein translocase subunit SecF